jgi:hypothetical protein
MEEGGGKEGVPAAVEVRVGFYGYEPPCQPEKKKERKKRKEKEKGYQRNSSTHDPHFPRTVVENEDFELYVKKKKKK